MISWKGFDGQVDTQAPLADRTWFGLGGPAHYLAHPRDEGALADVFRRAFDGGAAVKVLGGGANLLIRDEGFAGVVVRLDADAFKRYHVDGCQVIAGAGVDLMDLTRHCSRLGLSGMECLAGIPGTVGGSIRMNAGGRYGEIADSTVAVHVIDQAGARRTMFADEVGFGYRHSNLDGMTVTGATFALQPDHPESVYARFKEIWREKKAEQPMAAHSAGCIFANPPGASAGRLIDRAGLKGTRLGAARVSERHANFIEADRGAKSDDVLRLIDRVRDTVRDRFSTELRLEIDVW